MKKKLYLMICLIIITLISFITTTFCFDYTYPILGPLIMHIISSIGCLSLIITVIWFWIMRINGDL